MLKKLRTISSAASNRRGYSSWILIHKLFNDISKFHPQGAVIFQFDDFLPEVNLNFVDFNYGSTDVGSVEYPLPKYALYGKILSIASMVLSSATLMKSILI